ncbi:MAG: CYTH domain-containing protein, partial [Lachnospiraceae bacterium]|nr:CYTH domain-containing protein [Lachnospiraceae bacterium]
MEIERKFLIGRLPDQLEKYPFSEIEQAYLNDKPVIRIRKSGDRYILTVKGEGVLAHEEYELPLSEDSFLHLMAKADGRIIRKTRYKIPYGNYTIELDLFHGDFEGLQLAEVE